MRILKKYRKVIPISTKNLRKLLFTAVNVENLGKKKKDGVLFTKLFHKLYT